MATRPHRRQRRRHKHSQRPPSATNASPKTGMAGSRITAPGQPATVRAAQMTPSMPHPMGASAKPSRPNVMRKKATMAQGMTHSAVSGTATRLATSP